MGPGSGGPELLTDQQTSRQTGRRAEKRDTAVSRMGAGPEQMNQELADWLLVPWLRFEAM